MKHEIYYTPGPGTFTAASRTARNIHHATGQAVALRPVSPKPGIKPVKLPPSYYRQRAELKAHGAKYETGGGWWMDDVYLGRTMAEAWTMFQKIQGGRHENQNQSG